MRISDWSSDVCSSDLGHAIGGLTINRPSADYVGLFGFQGGGTISRTGVIGVSVIGDPDVGGLVGHQVSGSIGQRHATGSVTRHPSVRNRQIVWSGKKVVVSVGVWGWVCTEQKKQQQT